MFQYLPTAEQVRVASLTASITASVTASVPWMYGYHSHSSSWTNILELSVWKSTVNYNSYAIIYVHSQWKIMNYSKWKIYWKFHSSRNFAKLIDICMLSSFQRQESKLRWVYINIIEIIIIHENCIFQWFNMSPACTLYVPGTLFIIIYEI